MPPAQRVCAMCGRVLDSLTRDGVTTYIHSFQDQPEDHVPVPVAPGQVPERPRCDFCNNDEPTHRLPVDDFVIMGTHTSVGDWSACDKCAALIGAGDWEGVIRRVGRTAIERSVVRRLYFDLLIPHIKGKIERIK